jgi:hypothetical protein
VARLQAKLAELHGTDLNHLKRAHLSLTQHIQALRLEAQVGWRCTCATCAIKPRPPCTPPPLPHPGSCRPSGRSSARWSRRWSRQSLWPTS